MKIVNQEKLLAKIEDILDYFNVSYKSFSTRLAFPCPIHEGSKSDGASIYLKPKNGVGIWKCWTNHCEEEVGKSLLSLTKALLSRNGKNYSIDETIIWLEQFLDDKITEPETHENITKHRTVNLSLQINKIAKEEISKISRQDIINNLNIPADFFLKREYKKETLLKYDVGLCTKAGKQMFNRIVTPVYNDNYEFMIGCIGRTQKPQCIICKKFHYETEHCPSSSFDEYLASKWINSTGFQGENHLYNFWFAKEYINASQTAILCEGAPDVWRLSEAGIDIGLGLFGAHLTDFQASKLEKLSLLNIIVATDNDEAGIEAKHKIITKLWKLYNIYEVELPKKDVGDLTIQETKDVFYPLLEKLHVQQTV